MQYEFPLQQHTEPAPLAEKETLMDEHSSYHGAIEEEEAVLRLRLSGVPHCYLTRYSKDKNMYVLSVFMKQSTEDVIEHYTITINGNKYQIESKFKVDDFNSIEQLLEHYMAKRISHSLPNIGESYKLEEYDARQKWVDESAVGGHSSYHNDITAEEAMSRLKQSGHNHCYLTYFSKEKRVYFLAVYLNHIPHDVEEHFAIIMVSNKYKIEGKNEEFDSFESLLDHYTSKRFNPCLPGVGYSYSFDDYSEKQKSPQYNMMGEHSSYHSAITEEEAMHRLQRSGQPHCYLTYFNEAKQKYVLAVYQKQHRDVRKHFPIIIRDGMHKLERKQEEFDSIDKLLEHYKTKRIDPSLANIGNNYMLESYSPKKCVIS